MRYNRFQFEFSFPARLSLAEQYSLTHIFPRLITAPAIESDEEANLFSIN
jgi:hypothetical protein